MRGLPKKDEKRKPMFDYEGILYKALLQRGYLNIDNICSCNLSLLDAEKE
jgi:hypothetical protein